MREKLKALRGFTYAGKALVPGDRFEASRQDARVLRAVGRAKPFSEPVVQATYVAPALPVEVTKDAAQPQAPARGKPGRKPKADRAE